MHDVRPVPGRGGARGRGLATGGGGGAARGDGGDGGCRRGCGRSRVCLLHWLLPVVDVQRANRPVRRRHLLGMVLHELLAAHPGGVDGAVHRVGCPAPVAAEGQVEDHAHVLEVLPRARLRRQAEKGEGQAPCPGLWPAIHDVRGLQAPRPEPGAEVPTQRPPLCRESSASLGIEGRAHGTRGAHLCTALVLPLSRRFDVAVPGLGAPGPHLPLPEEVLARFHRPLVAPLGRVQRALDAL
mmetsp:Transcript_14167/g.32160  ORF Transcript_14167/g.32160 Transcript_14167/m.32160 type:complete len:240 (-) Transcript_14167:210-929(-)